MKKYTAKGKVWVYPGLGGWHFIYVDRPLAEKVKNDGKQSIYGAGFIGIRATLGATSWDTAPFPSKKDSTYLLSIKKAVRIKEACYDGDVITITFTLR
jgi:hypothetical protein